MQRDYKLLVQKEKEYNKATLGDTITLVIGIILMLACIGGIACLFCLMFGAL